MRTLLAALIACGCVSLVEAAEWPPAEEYTYENICDQLEPKDKCRSHAADFKKYYELAIKGDYEGQGMIAMAFSRDMVGIKHSPSLACAWSHVLLRSGHLLADSNDTNNNEYYCGKLKPAELTLALAQASRLMQMLAENND